MKNSLFSFLEAANKFLFKIKQRRFGITMDHQSKYYKTSYCFTVSIVALMFQKGCGQWNDVGCGSGTLKSAVYVKNWRSPHFLKVRTPLRLKSIALHSTLNSISTPLSHSFWISVQKNWRIMIKNIYRMFICFEFFRLK